MTEQEYYLTRCLENVMPTLLQPLLDKLEAQNNELKNLATKLDNIFNQLQISEGA